MKSLSIIFLLVLLSGCNSTFYDHFNHHRNLNGLASIGLIPDKQKNGYRSYDTCVQCGENWVFLSHPPLSNKEQK